MPFEFVLLYEGYTAREKTADFRAAWQTSLMMNMWKDEKSPAITVSDILPWVPNEPARTETKSKRLEAVGGREKVEGYSKVIIDYAALTGKDLETLTPEEVSVFETEAINYSVASELNAPGFKMFERKKYGKFPD